MKIALNLSQSDSIAGTYIAQLRDTNVQSDPLRFRTNLSRISQIIAYEISKTLDYKEETVETPLGITSYPKVLDNIIIASILRAGLPMHHGMLNSFDNAQNAFVSAYRRHHKDGTFEIDVEYVSCPDLEDTTLILSDPMIATGASMVKSLDALLEHGTPKDIHIATIIATKEGLDTILRTYPNAQIWLGAIDQELTAKSYIVPGLGDAGDLAFGPKVQS